MIFCPNISAIPEKPASGWNKRSGFFCGMIWIIALMLLVPVSASGASDADLPTVINRLLPDHAGEALPVALRYHREATESGNKEILAEATYLLALVYYKQSRFETSNRYLADLGPEDPETDTEIAVRSLILQGRNYFRLDALDRAMESWNRGMRIALNNGMLRLAAEIRMHVAGIDHATGYFAEAEEELNELIGFFDNGGYSSEMARAQLMYGALLLDRQEFENALAQTRSAGDYFRRAGHPFLETQTKLQHARILLKQGRVGESETLARQLQLEIRVFQSGALAAELSGIRAGIAAEKQDYAEAIRLYEEVIRSYMMSGEAARLGEIVRKLHHTHLIQGDAQSAENLLRRHSDWRRDQGTTTNENILREWRESFDQLRERHQNAVREYERQQAMMFYVALGIGVVVLLVVLFILVRKKGKMNEPETKPNPEPESDVKPEPVQEKISESVPSSSKPEKVYDEKTSADIHVITPDQPVPNPPKNSSSGGFPVVPEGPRPLVEKKFAPFNPIPGQRTGKRSGPPRKPTPVKETPPDPKPAENPRKTGTFDDQKMEELFGRIKKLIESKHLYRDKNISVSVIASRLETNDRYVSQAVNQFSGSNFNGFINAYRAEEACRLMRENPDLPVKDIASKAGYGSVSSFHRLFKKETGQTPSQYVEESRG